MEKFFLFAGYYDDSDKGWEDFGGEYESLMCAKQEGEFLVKDDSAINWYQIVNAKTLKKIYEYVRE